MRYHVHVYHVVNMKEFDVEARSEEEARAKALDLAKTSGSLLKADTGNIALSFKVGDNGQGGESRSV